MPTRNLETLSKSVQAALDKIQSAAEREMLGNYRAVLEEFRGQLASLFERYSADGILTHAEMTRYNRLLRMEADFTERLGAVLAENKKTLSKLTGAEYEESYFRNAWAIEQSTGAALKWGALNEATIKAATESELLQLANAELTLKAKIQLRRTIVQGLLRGSSYQQMARDLKEFTGKLAWENLRIARTEAHKAAVKGQLDNYDSAPDGLELKRIWVATLDDRTRPDHGTMDGVAADAEGMFHTPWGPVTGPGIEGPAEEVINCRCRVRAEVEGLPAPAIRRIRDEGVQEYTTYTDWVKKKGWTRNKYGQEITG